MTYVQGSATVAGETRRHPVAHAPTTPGEMASVPEIPDNVVKSAARVFQILEMFDDTRTEANAADVARRLGYPQSSASVLLRSLAKLGYLSYNEGTRSYRPTIRVRLLGGWINPPLLGDSQLHRMVDDLNAATGQAVFLAVRNGMDAQYIHTAQATTTLRLHLPIGAKRPAARCSSGRALLSLESDREIKKVVLRSNAELKPGQRPIQLGPFMEQIEQTRKTGFAIARHSELTPGASVITCILPEAVSDQQRIVLGIGGSSKAVLPQIENILRKMVTLVRNFSKEDNH